MTPFVAILKITVKAALRSNIFRVLLFILLLTIFLLPVSIVGDGTAESFIKISLNYCLSSISLILSLSTIWLACYIMATDIESYRIHMVISKPIARATIWLAKWTGVVMINSALLIISATTIYLMVMWHYSKIDFDKKEKERINNQILVGRRVFKPFVPTLNTKTNNLFQLRLDALAKEGRQLSEKEQLLLRDNIKNYLSSSEGEVKYGMTKIWRYKNLTGLKKKKLPLYVRYRLYPDKFDLKKQMQTYGIWAVRVPEKTLAQYKKNPHNSDKALFITKTDEPELLPCALFKEFSFFSSNVIDKKNQVIIAFINADSSGNSLHFQTADGPDILVKITGFLENYIRAIFLIFLQIALLGAIACAFGGLLSMPVSITFVFAYLIMGAASQYLVNFYNSLDPAVAAIKNNLNIYDLVGRSLSSFLMLFIVPISEFNTANLLSSGELIELSFIADKFFFGFLLKGFTIMLLGIYLFSKREFGLVVKNDEK